MTLGHRFAGIASMAALLAVLLLAAGCSSNSGESDVLTIAKSTRTATPSLTATPTIVATATATPTSTPTFSEPTVEPSLVPPSPTAVPSSPTPGAAPAAAAPVELSPAEIGQGHVAKIGLWASGASSSMAIFAERRYPLVADGGYFWGILGTTADQPPGVYPVTIQLFEENGALLGELSTQISVLDVEYPVEYITLPPESTALLTPEMAQEEENIRAGVFALFTAQKLWSGLFMLPVQAPIVSPYGIGRSYNGAPVSGYHHGVDLAAEEGTWVVASNSGRVAYVGPAPLRGNSVIIDHGVGVFSGYHHLSSMAVQEGQMVNKGDLIGAVGSTGLVTGPHLHWEIVIRGVEVDPMPWTTQEMVP